MANEPRLVYLRNQCFLEEKHENNFSSPRKLRDHLRDSHGYQFPVAMKSTRRYNSSSFLYLQHPDHSRPSTENFSCPACLDHFDDLNGLATHFFITHKEFLPQQDQEQEQRSSSAGSTIQQRTTDEILPQEQEQGRQVISSNNASGTELLDNNDTISSSSGSAIRKQPNDEKLSLEGIVFSLPDSDHLIVNGFNLSYAFHQLQQSVSAKWKHSLEEHVHLALASTSVLWLTRNRYPQDVSAFISYANWNAAVDSVEEMYGIKRQPIPLVVTSSLISIVDDLLNEKINREQANVRMISLSLEPNAHKFAKALGLLLQKLPNQPLEEDFGEAELCTRFVDPFLCGLFDSPDHNVYLRWTNESTLEAKSANGSNERPDICITKSLGVRWTTNLGYGEAKSAARDQDNYLICWDLLKVTIFCKEALDSQQMEGMLGMQIIGRTIKFYLLVLPASGLYGLIDLAVIKLPDSLQNLTSFVTEVANVLKVLDAFDRVCVPASDAPTIMSRCTPTVSMAKLAQLFTSSRNRKKRCHVKLRNN